MEEQYYFIGEAAGKIYKTLETKGQTEVLKLQKDAEVSSEVLFNQAIGWLAREGKVSFNKSSKGLKISLVKASV